MYSYCETMMHCNQHFSTNRINMDCNVINQEFSHCSISCSHDHFFPPDPIRLTFRWPLSLARFWGRPFQHAPKEKEKTPKCLDKYVRLDNGAQKHERQPAMGQLQRFNFSGTVLKRSVFLSLSLGEAAEPAAAHFSPGLKGQEAQETHTKQNSSPFFTTQRSALAPSIARSLTKPGLINYPPAYFLRRAEPILRTTSKLYFLLSLADFLPSV